MPRRRADAQLHLGPRAVQLKRGGGRADEVVGALHRDARDVPDALHALEERLVVEEAIVHLRAHARSLDAWATGLGGRRVFYGVLSGPRGWREG